MIFYSYVSLPEGNINNSNKTQPEETRQISMLQEWPANSSFTEKDCWFRVILPSKACAHAAYENNRLKINYNAINSHTWGVLDEPSLLHIYHICVDMFTIVTSFTFILS